MIKGEKKNKASTYQHLLLPESDPDYPVMCGKYPIESSIRVSAY